MTDLIMFGAMPNMVQRARAVENLVDADERGPFDVKRVLAEKFRLSAQEIRIAFLAAQGHRNREIAELIDQQRAAHD